MDDIFENYCDGYFDYKYKNGKLIVYHVIRDRNDYSDPYSFCFFPEDLQKIHMDTFISFFCNHFYNTFGSSHTEGLREWLIEKGIQFADPDSPEDRKTFDRAEDTRGYEIFNSYREREMKRAKDDVLVLDSKNVNPEMIAKMLEKHSYYDENEARQIASEVSFTARVYDKKEFCREMKELGCEVLTNEDIKVQRRPAPEPPKRKINPFEYFKTVKQEWVTDINRFFSISNMFIPDGEMVANYSETWCDFRDGDKGTLLEHLYSIKWGYNHCFVVYSENNTAAVKSLIEELSVSHPEMNIRWLTEIENKDPEVLVKWFELVSGKQYSSKVEMVGYSHDGSGTYYSVVTEPSEGDA